MRKKIILYACVVIILMTAMGLGGRFLIAPMLDHSITFMPSENENDDTTVLSKTENATDPTQTVPPSIEPSGEITDSQDSVGETEGVPQTGFANSNGTTNSEKNEQIQLDSGTAAGTSAESQSNNTSDSASDRIMNAASSEEIAQGSAILSKIDAGKFFSLMEEDRAAAKEYLYSCLSQDEINTAMKLYEKYGGLLN